MKKHLISLLSLTAATLSYGLATELPETDHRNSIPHIDLPVENIEQAKSFYSEVFEVEALAGETPDHKPVYALK